MSNRVRAIRREARRSPGRRGYPRPVPYDEVELNDLLTAQGGPTPTERRRLDEWQYAADLAELALTLDACHQFGLVTGGPTVRVDRCHEVLAQAERRGITPAVSDDMLTGFARELAS